MKKTLSTTLLLLFVMNGFSQSTLPPFTIGIEEITQASLPGIHSFAKAQSGSRWLMVCGRTDGLHGMYPNSAFAPEYANTNLFVVDTTDWSVHSASVFSLSYEIQTSLRATNTEFFQDGNHLYIIGGYGYDSLLALKKTFSTLTAIDVDETIQEIVSGTNNLSPYIRQISDTALAVTGGKLEKVGNVFFLAGGHRFDGLYTKTNTGLFTQHYTNSISRFTIDDDGVNLSLGVFVYNVDTVNYHRRDLNTAQWVMPGLTGFDVFGGVFQYDHNFPFENPVHVDWFNAIGVDTFHQFMSQYTCPVIPVYDSVNTKMFFNFFGGISMNNYVDSLSSLVLDTLVPFINDVSTITRDEAGNSSQVILPVKLPGRLGANAEFFPNENIPRYSNGVVKLNELVGKTLLGYMFGGIETNAEHEGTSLATNRLFRIFLTPDVGTDIESPAQVSDLKIYPNPSSDFAVITFSVKQSGIVSLKLFDAIGNEVMTISEKNFTAGDQQVYLKTSSLTSGFYMVKMISGNESSEHSLAIVR